MATVVDTHVLGELILGAFAAGIFVTSAFGVVIYGSTRFADLRREGNAVGAAFFALVAAIALVTFFGSVAFGIVVMTNKG